MRRNNGINIEQEKEIVASLSSLYPMQKFEEEAIDVVLGAIPHWIPVTERLPETTDAVLTTYIVNGDRSRRYVEESSYYGNDESWSNPWDEYRIIAGTRIEVIAWQPLPEPFKGVTT